MAKGLLFHLCCSQAQALSAMRKGVEFWIADIDLLTFPADVQEWIRRCGKVRDEVVCLHHQIARLAQADAKGRFPSTAAAFCAALDAALEVFAVVSGAMQRSEKLGQTANNSADFDRSLGEITQIRKRFAAQYPEVSSAEVAAELAVYGLPSAPLHVHNSTDTACDLRVIPAAPPPPAKKPSILIQRRS